MEGRNVLISAISPLVVSIQSCWYIQVLQDQEIGWTSVILSDGLISIDRKSETPVYLQITSALIHNIRRGLLRRGAKLPGTHKLATALSTNRKTVQAAYDELMAQGWIEILPRKGAFLAHDLPEIAPPSEKPSAAITGMATPWGLTTCSKLWRNS
jgi:DNA-binding transcriptional regulator YhcF (GntR family)